MLFVSSTYPMLMVNLSKLSVDNSDESFIDGVLGIFARMEDEIIFFLLDDVLVDDGVDGIALLAGEGV